MAEPKQALFLLIWLIEKTFLFVVFFLLYLGIVLNVEMFFRDITLPVGHEEGGEGQGYDEADEAEDGTPHREGEKQDGGVEAHGLAHDLGRHNHVGDNLHHGKDKERHAKHIPEVLTRVGGLEHGKERRGDEGKGVEVRHKVHDAYEDAEAYGHGAVDDAEADAEHYAHAQRHQTLTTDVVVHLALDVAHEHMPEGTVLLGEDFYPVVGEILIVEQYEEHVEQHDAGADDAEHNVGSLAEQGEELGHGGFHRVAEVFAVEELLQLALVLACPLSDELCEVVGVGGLLHPPGEHVAKLLKLLYHGRDDEVDNASDDGNDHNHGYDDGNGTNLDVKLVLHKLDGGVEQIGKEPGYEERQQHLTEIVDCEQHDKHASRYERPSYEFVECYFLFKHDVLPPVSFWFLLLFRFFLLFQDSFLVTLATQRLIFGLLAKHDALVAAHDAVTQIGEVATLHADGMHLRDIVGNGTESRNGTEGHTLEVHVQASDDYPYPTVRQLVAHVNQSVVKKLSLVNAHHVDVARQQQDRC